MLRVNLSQAQMRAIADAFAARDRHGTEAGDRLAKSRVAAWIKLERAWDNAAPWLRDRTFG